MIELTFMAGPHQVTVHIDPRDRRGYLERGPEWDKIRIERGRLDNSDKLFKCPLELEHRFEGALSLALQQRCDEWLARPSVVAIIEDIQNDDRGIEQLRQQHQQELLARVRDRDAKYLRFHAAAEEFGGFTLWGFPRYYRGEAHEKHRVVHTKKDTILEEWYPELDPDDYPEGGQDD